MSALDDAAGLLQVTAEARGSTQVLSVVGQVDVANTAELAGEIHSAIGREPETIVLDLSEVAFFGSDGLSTLFEADGRARAAGCRLVIIPGTGPVQRLFDYTDAQRLLTVAS